MLPDARDDVPPGAVVAMMSTVQHDLYADEMQRKPSSREAVQFGRGRARIMGRWV